MQDCRRRPTPPPARPPSPATGATGRGGTIRRVNYALFDDAGKFLAGRVMSEADASVQIELDSGKRVKVKAANVLLRFVKPEPAALMAAAQAQAAEIDLEMAWEFAPEGPVRRCSALAGRLDEATHDRDERAGRVSGLRVRGRPGAKPAAPSR